MSASDDKMLVQLTVRELRDLVREAVRSARAEQPSVPEYLTAEQVAEMIGCTVDSIRTFCGRDGLPCVRIGKLRRFHLADVVTWLEERRTQKPRKQEKP